MRYMTQTPTYDNSSSLPDNDDDTAVKPTERAEKNNI